MVPDISNEVRQEMKHRGDGKPVADEISQGDNSGREEAQC